VQLSPGDRVCFYTDGLVEAYDEIGETFGNDRLTECVAVHGCEPAERLAQTIVSAQRTFRGNKPLTDDLTLVVVEFRG
jgi:phosphoserine phosphatase RsbU/P